jgi:hypothetical protein
MQSTRATGSELTSNRSMDHTSFNDLEEGATFCVL